jgi:hypothetical protein
LFNVQWTVFQLFYQTYIERREGMGQPAQWDLTATEKNGELDKDEKYNLR